MPRNGSVISRTDPKLALNQERVSLQVPETDVSPGQKEMGPHLKFERAMVHCGSSIICLRQVTN